MTRSAWFCMSLFAVYVVLPSASHSQQTPSPAFMIESWKVWSSDFHRVIHSYRLQGRQQVVRSGITINGVSAVGPASMWATVKAGDRYRFEMPGMEYKAASYDGSRWYYIVTTPSLPAQHSIENHGPYIGGNPILSSFQQSDTHPLTLEAFLESPWHSPSSIPLYEQYLTRLSRLQFVGVERINGRVCYHLHLTRRRSDEGLLPDDIWMTVINGRFLPWQLENHVSGAGQGIVTTLKGAEYQGLWYPVECAYVIESGQTVVQEVQKRFPISDINRTFAATEFQLKPPPGAERYVDDKQIREPKPKSVPKPNAYAVARRIFGIVFALSSLLLLLSFLKRRS